jgi:predicted  nucleic acid-binding Zn-ribbon protein
MTTQNIKDKLDKVMENFRTKNQMEILEIESPFTQTENTVEGHSHRLEQAEGRISELEDKIESKEKNRRNLSQRTQEL